MGNLIDKMKTYYIVISKGQVYPSHGEWMNRNAPEYIKNWTSGLNPLKDGNEVEIIVRAPHSPGSIQEIALVTVPSNDKVAMIGIEGLRLIKKSNHKGCS